MSDAKDPAIIHLDPFYYGTAFHMKLHNPDDLFDLAVRVHEERLRPRAETLVDVRSMVELERFKATEKGRLRELRAKLEFPNVRETGNYVIGFADMTGKVWSGMLESTFIHGGYSPTSRFVAFRLPSEEPDVAQSIYGSFDKYDGRLLAHAHKLIHNGELPHIGVEKELDFTAARINNWLDGPYRLGIMRNEMKDILRLIND